MREADMKVIMGNRIKMVILILIFSYTGLVLSCLSTPDERWTGNFWKVQPFSESTVRLHVVAKDNERDSQLFKMKIVESVQDLLAEEGFPRADRCNSYYLLKNLSRIEYRLRQHAGTQTDFPPEISVFLTKEEFPLRAYGRMIYPSGEYTALKIVIGEGLGDNWWCLLFPALCLPFAEAVEVKNDDSSQSGTEDRIEKKELPAPKKGWRLFIFERWNRWFAGS